MKELRPVFKDGKVVRSGRVVRRTADPYDHSKLRVVIALEPGDVIALKYERSRKWFKAPINQVFRQVMMWNVDAARAAKRLERRRR